MTDPELFLNRPKTAFHKTRKQRRPRHKLKLREKPKDGNHLVVTCNVPYPIYRKAAILALANRETLSTTLAILLEHGLARNSSITKYNKRKKNNG